MDACLRGQSPPKVPLHSQWLSAHSHPDDQVIGSTLAGCLPSVCRREGCGGGGGGGGMRGTRQCANSRILREEEGVAAHQEPLTHDS